MTDGWTHESRTTVGRLVHQARSDGTDPAFIVLERKHATTLSWDDLLRASVLYARRYEELGVRRGDTVLLCLAHSPSMYPAFLGAMLLGAVPGFLAIPSAKQDAALYWASHEALLHRIRPSLVITHSSNVDALRAAAPSETAVLGDAGIEAVEGTIDELIAPYDDSEPDAIALLQHSSGTTGLKKGVQLTHDQIALSVEATSEALEHIPSDRVVSWLPLYHDMGLFTAFIAPIHNRITTVSLDAFDWVTRPHRLLEAMDEHHGTHVFMPNFAYGHLVRTKQGDETYQLGHVKGFYSGSEPVKPKTFDRFVAAFSEHGVRRNQLFMGYGLAEAVMTIAVVRPGSLPREVHLDAEGLARDVAIPVEPNQFSRVHLSNGPLVKDVEIRIDAPDATDGSPIGEIQLRGPFMFAGYHLDDEATAKVMDGEWVRTGDLGCVIDDEVYVLGRIKDVIIHHGVNFFAHDIEEAVSAVKGVKKGRCVAVAVYDEEVGSEAIEVIAERDPDDLRADVELVAAIRKGVADLFPIVLAKVHVRDPGWMVKTTSGKVSRGGNLAKLEQPASRRELRPGDVRRRTAPRSSRRSPTTFFVDAGQPEPRDGRLRRQRLGLARSHRLLLRLGRALGVEIPEDIAARSSQRGRPDRPARAAPGGGVDDGRPHGGRHLHGPRGPRRLAVPRHLRRSSR